MELVQKLVGSMHLNASASVWVRTVPWYVGYQSDSVRIDAAGEVLC